MLLENYIAIMKGSPRPLYKQRKLQYSPDLGKLSLTIPPDDTLDFLFHEILWRILVKYDLQFRTENDGTFYIYRGAAL